MATSEQEEEWKNILSIEFTKYANPGDRNRGPGTEQLRNQLEKFHVLKAALGESLACKLTSRLLAYIQRTPTKPGLDNYTQRLWLIPFPKPGFEQRLADLKDTNLALDYRKLEWVVTTHYSIAMLFCEAGHRVAGIATGLPIETPLEQEENLKKVYMELEHFHNREGAGFDEELGMTKNGIIWLRNCKVKEPIPFTPTSDFLVHEIVKRRFSSYSIETCFTLAFPAGRAPIVQLTDAVKGKPVYLVQIDRDELQRGRNISSWSFATMNTKQSTWIVTFDWNIAQSFEAQGGYTIMGVEFLVGGEDRYSLSEMYDCLKEYYTGAGEVYFGGFFNGLDVTRNGLYWLRIANEGNLQFKAPRTFKTVAVVLRSAFT